MINRKEIMEKIHSFPVSSREWMRLGTGSALSFLSIGMFIESGFPTTPENAVIPIILTVIGAILVWPVIFRLLFSKQKRTDPDEIYNRVMDADEK